MLHLKNSHPRQTKHAVIEVSITERKNAALPLLILGDGEEAEPSVLAATYLRNRQLEGIDVVTLFRHAKAIGLLYDYYVIEKKSPILDERGLQLLIKNFWEARRHGCETLGWKPVTYKTARDDLNSITEFSDFCNINFKHINFNPSEKVFTQMLKSGDFQSWLKKTFNRKKYSMLLHLAPSNKELHRDFKKRNFNPELNGHYRIKNSGFIKHFPPDKVIDFILETKSLRNRLCWLLMFFGGLRISELAHLFIGDIQRDYSDNSARVIVANPRDAPINWISNGKHRQGTRSAFLYDKYGRVPRTELATRNPEHAGWKGMTYDNVRRMESIVHWSSPPMGQLFWKLHTEYMRTARLHIGDEHPYYFVSLRGESYGEPMKLGSLRKQFYDNLFRIRIDKSIEGTNPHSARHFYGWYCANLLKLPKERTQKLMHHSSITSTEVYYNLDQATIKNELTKAHNTLEKNIPTFLDSSRLLPKKES